MNFKEEIALVSEIINHSLFLKNSSVKLEPEYLQWQNGSNIEGWFKLNIILNGNMIFLNPLIFRSYSFNKYSCDTDKTINTVFKICYMDFINQLSFNLPIKETLSDDNSNPILSFRDLLDPNIEEFVKNKQMITVRK